MGAACSHTPRHLGLGEALFLHGFLHLPRQHVFHGVIGGVLVNTFFLEEVLKGRADVRILAHWSSSFCRARAKSNSDCGVFCVFLMKPCNSTMRPCAAQKMTRAMRLFVMLLRTS